MLRDVAKLVISNLLVLLMFSVGLQTNIRQVLAEVRRPALLLRELAVFALGVPLLAVLVVRALAIPPVASALLVLFAICPAAPFVLRRFSKETSAAPKALAVVGVALAGSVVIVPAWVWILNRGFGFHLAVPLWKVVSLLAVKIFAPLVVGVAVRRLWPTGAAPIGRVTNVVLAILLVIASILLVKVGVGTLRLVTPRVALALFVISIGSALLGELAAGKDPELREIFGLTAMTGNPAIALAVIAASYPELHVGALIAASLVCHFIAALPYQLFMRRRRAKRNAIEHASAL